MIKTNYEAERQNAQSKQPIVFSHTNCIELSQFSCLEPLYAQILNGSKAQCISNNKWII